MRSSPSLGPTLAQWSLADDLDGAEMQRLADEAKAGLEAKSGQKLPRAFNADGSQS